MTALDERRDDTVGEVDIASLPLRPRLSWQRKVITVIAVAYAITVAWSIRRTGLSFSALVEGYGDFRRLLNRMLPIEFRDPGRIVELAVETFFMAFIGTALAVALSIPIALGAARNTSPHRLVFVVCRAIIVLMRAIPDLIFALIFVRAVGIGVLAGVLAIALNSIGMVGKLYADAIEQIDEGPREAVLATGASRLRAIVTGVFPQVLPAFIGTGLYRLDINFRTSTILGYVGAGGIGILLQQYLGGLQYDRALGVVTVIVVLVLAVEFISASVRASILGTDAFRSKRLSVRIAAAARRRRAGVTDVVTGASGDDQDLSRQTLAFDPHRIKPPWTPQRKRMAFWGYSALAMLVYAAWSTRISPLRLLTSVDDLYRITLKLVPKNFDWWSDRVFTAMIETVAIGFAASSLGLVISIPLAYLAARNVAPARWVYYFGRTLLVGIRALPDLIIAVLFVSAVGLGPFPGVMALSIGTIGFATKLLADSIEEVSQGPRDAIMSVGTNRVQEAATGVTPQFMPALIGTSLYILDVNMRAATILGIVGGGGIGFILIQGTRTLNWELVGGILLTIFGLVYAIELLSGWIRKQLL
jgi:phosphonate transport system permease protein